MKPKKIIVDQYKTRHTCDHIFNFDFRILWVQGLFKWP